MFEADSAPAAADLETLVKGAASGTFRTPAEPEAGWASRNPDRAMLFLYVTPRTCGALEELMAL